ncbi:hypothetical protein SAMN04487881_2182 [Marinobacter sp. es.048]|nr:hypothetical protein SAMN04487881_2182 [Marinobacter sp. es.048]
MNEVVSGLAGATTIRQPNERGVGHRGLSIVSHIQKFSPAEAFDAVFREVVVGRVRLKGVVRVAGIERGDHPAKPVMHDFESGLF